jgi:hypothetical protein
MITHTTGKHWFLMLNVIPAGPFLIQTLWKTHLFFTVISLAPKLHSAKYMSMPGKIAHNGYLVIINILMGKAGHPQLIILEFGIYSP